MESSDIVEFNNKASEEYLLYRRVLTPCPLGGIKSGTAPLGHCGELPVPVAPGGVAANLGLLAEPGVPLEGGTPGEPGVMATRAVVGEWALAGMPAEPGVPATALEKSGRTCPKLCGCMFPIDECRPEGLGAELGEWEELEVKAGFTLRSALKGLLLLACEVEEVEIDVAG